MFRRFGRVGWKLGAGAGVIGGAGYLALRRNHYKGMPPDDIHYRLDSNAKVPTRQSMVNRMKEENFDIIVLGGGATGSGVALDAATRGLKCALVEGSDFASGTSSRSTKLIHGGVRYLEAAFKNLDIKQLYLVWEALEERAHMLRCAPFMSHPLPIVLPIYQWYMVPYSWFGLKAYDWLAKLVTCFDTGVPSCFRITRDNALFLFPLLNPNKLKGALVYYDGQHNDSRMNIQIALTSTIAGYVEGMEPAAVANYCKVKDFIKNEAGTQLIGVVVTDLIAGEDFKLYGKVIINCTGPFADTVRTLAEPDCRPLVSPASGTHIVLPKFYAPSNFGMMISDTSDGRVLFFLPWEENTVAGTTDSKSDLAELPKPTEAEVDFIVKESSRYLTIDCDTIKRDIAAVWSGLRPLVKDPNCPEEGASSKLSRSHEIIVDKSGLVSILGGKWTTYRRMAQDALEKIQKEMPDVIKIDKPCRTKQLLLYPAVDPTGQDTSKDAQTLSGPFPLRLKTAYNLTLEQAAHLVRNYGYLALDVCELGKAHNTLSPLVANQPFLRCEILYSVRHELAEKVADVLGRRIRVAFVDSAEAKRLVTEVADIMAKELNWSSARKEAEKKEAHTFLDTMNITST